MKRRNFLLSATALSAFAIPACTLAGKGSSEKENTNKYPGNIAGIGLKEHRNELKSRLYDEYLPFWDNGGYDKQYGGFICNLDKNGIPVDDSKFIWYQGRAIWVYSFLYNNFGKDKKYLEIARHTRDFLVKQMYTGDGKWVELVHKDGKVIKGVEPGSNIYGWLFAANGLAEYYKISGDPEDLRLAKESILAGVKAYDSPQYQKGTDNEGYRIQGHSMIFIRLLSQLLSHHNDAELEALLNFHVDKIMSCFYKPEYRISNEILNHDYSRIKGKEDETFLGHSLETQWMLMHLAIQRKDEELFKKSKDNFRRYLELGWDHIFDGWGDEEYTVFGNDDNILGTDFSSKSMWSHTEILVGCMLVIEKTGEYWAMDYYDRTWEYVKKTFSRGIGAWEQAVNRFGEPIDRKKHGINPMRRGNFHQPRYLMMAILSLDRMIKKNN